MDLHTVLGSLSGLKDKSTSAAKGAGQGALNHSLCQSWGVGMPASLRVKGHGGCSNLSLDGS